jgi:hypothetical protein
MARLDHHTSRGSGRVAPAHVALVAIILVAGCVQPEARGGMSASATPTDLGAAATQVPSLAPAPRDVLADGVIDTRASVRWLRATADAVWAGVQDAVLRLDPETGEIVDSGALWRPGHY